jgi:chitinase
LKTKYAPAIIIIVLGCILFPGARVFAQFKVVGYVHPQINVPPEAIKVSLNRLTHLNIAFINPDSAGNIKFPAELDTMVVLAHEANVKVLASLGGGSHNPFIAGLLADSRRRIFTGRLVQFAIDHQLDGIDVDLENDAIDSNYAPFIIELGAALKLQGKLITAALATWNAEIIPTSALEKFDFINVMSYDQTGPWRPEKPGPHSTFKMAEADLSYWISRRGLPQQQLNLGLPFYGYCFNTRYGESMSYADILTTFPGSELQDSVLADGGGVIHYNGPTTIRNKTLLALKKAGGVMIWQILQDAPGPGSLLFEVDRIVKGDAKK